MVAAEARKEKGNPGVGGASPMSGGPTDLNHMAGIEPDPQGVARLTEGGFPRGGSDEMTNWAAGKGRTNFPTKGDINGCGTDRFGEDEAVDPPKTRFDGTGTPGGGLKDPD